LSEQWYVSSYICWSHHWKMAKLAILRRAERCKAFSLRWVPSTKALLSHACLHHAASADSSSSSGEHFIAFSCLGKSPHWTKLHSESLQSFMVVFSVDTESLKCDTCSTCVPMHASPCTEMFILSLIVSV
jgi:hypothetical protein